MISLITGSGGFIGHELFSRLEGLGHEVIQLPYQEINKVILDEVDWVWFLSAYGNHIHQTSPNKTYKANVDDLKNLILRTNRLDYKGFFHFSTSSVLLDHQTFYSSTKMIGEYVADGLGKFYNKPIFSVRPYSVFGPGEAEHRFIPTVIKRMYAKEIIDWCPGMHDWVYIDDFIDACVLMMDNVHRITNPIHIGTGIQTDNLGVIDYLTKITKVKQRHLHKIEKMRDYDTSRWVCEDKQLMKFGWKPRPMRDGLQETVGFYAQT